MRTLGQHLPAGRPAAVVFAARAQPYRARAIRERFRGIGAEVDQEVLEVRRIAPHLRELIGEIELEPDAVSKRRTQQIGRILHGLVHVHGVEGRAVTSGVHQHLSAESRRTSAGRPHLLEMCEHPNRSLMSVLRARRSP